MPELTGKLDTSVNGPEGLPSFDGDAWERVDWRFHEEQVRRLRGRIFNHGGGDDRPAPKMPVRLVPDALTAMASFFLDPRIWASRRRMSSKSPAASPPGGAGRLG